MYKFTILILSLLLLLCFFSIAFATPQVIFDGQALAFDSNEEPLVEWEKTFSQGVFGRTVQETGDGGFIISGFAEDLSYHNYFASLLKTDSHGNTIFFKSYDIAMYCSADGVFTSAIQTNDGGYIIVGTDWINNYTCTDISMIKTDSFGNLLWQKTYGGLGYDYGYSVQQSSDGGYVIAGASIVNPDYSGRGFCDMILIKTDELGNLIWEKKYGGLMDDKGKSVQQTSDGGYIIVGSAQSNGIYLVKTDSSGNELWQKTFGPDGDKIGYSVQQTRDGGYIVVSNAIINSENIYLVKTDASGNIVWDKLFGGGNRSCGYSVKQTADDGYIITGTISSDVCIIKTDDLGNELWAKTLGGNYVDSGYSVIQTSDGGYLVCGKKDAHAATYCGDSYSDLYLIKLEPDDPNQLALTITTTSLSYGIVDTPYSTILAASGGITPYTWMADGLPAGLNINTVTGEVYGTPSTEGTSSVTATVYDSDRQSASKSFSLKVVYPTCIKGDVNNDTLTNVQDVVRTVNIILGKVTPTDWEGCSADVNNDEKINVQDVVKIVNMILGKV